MISSREIENRENHFRSWNIGTKDKLNKRGKKGKSFRVKRKWGCCGGYDVQIYRSILFPCRVEISPRPEVGRSNNVGYLNECEEERKNRTPFVHTHTHQSAPSAEVKSRFRLTICRFQEGKRSQHGGGRHNSFYSEQTRPCKFVQFLLSVSHVVTVFEKRAPL